jgi:hypothetical protein
MATINGSPLTLPHRPDRRYVPEDAIFYEYELVGSDTKTGGSWSFSVPAATRQGDIAIIGAATRNSSLGAPSAGSGASWTQVYLLDTSSAEWNGCWAKICNGSEPSTWSQTLSATGAGAMAVIRRKNAPFSLSATLSHESYQDAGVDYTPNISCNAGGLYVGVWTSCYNATVSDHAVGDLNNAAFVQQSIDEMATIHWRPVYETSTYGMYRHHMNDGGYRSTASIKVQD